MLPVRALLSVFTINNVAHAGDLPARRSSSISGLCEVADLEFDVGSHRLNVHGGAASTKTCTKLRPSWEMVDGASEAKMDSLLCDQVFEIGYFFKFKAHQPPGMFLRNVSIPLFKVLDKDASSKAAVDQGVVLPAIEHADSGVIDWDTNFFLESSLIKNQLIQAIARGCNVLPLDKRLSAVNKTLCFRKAYFGVPELSDQEAANVLLAFVGRVKETLAIHKPKPDPKRQPRIGLALPLLHFRTNYVLPDYRRTIAKVIAGFAKAVEIDYSRLSLKEQVMQTQDLDVVLVAGSDATSLSSALYLPPWGVVVRLSEETSGKKEDSVEHLLESRGVLLTATASPEASRSLNDVPVFGDNTISNIEHVLRKAVAIVQHNLQKL
ncbi:uncharacterized protein LOC119442035 [Dermacentor silvarum]|uniref:uncharacterized protein LOC119442035 n=1 Tax=Dermacentor silvarum TaxID=543639 RepID=UPI00210171F6|nr:uncharacterized protein LOC119442035 [Dermacentor silvarum]